MVTCIHHAVGFNHKPFSVKIICFLEIACIDTLVAAINGEFAFGQPHDVSESEQFDVLAESRFGVVLYFPIIDVYHLV